MPISYEIQSDGSVWTKLCGYVSADEYRAHPMNIAHDRNIQTPLRELFDTRELTETDVHVDDVQAVSHPPQELLAALADAKIAVIAKSPVSFGLGRMFQALSAAANFSVLVTTSYEEAVEFIQRR